VQTTTSNEASGWAICVASPTAYESHFGGFRPAQRNQVTRNIDAGDSPIAADSRGDAFAQKAWTATDIQYPLTG
jgi:hypothetical protein